MNKKKLLMAAITGMVALGVIAGVNVAYADGGSGGGAGCKGASGCKGHGKGKHHHGAHAHAKDAADAAAPAGDSK